MKSKLPPTPRPQQISRYGITEDSPIPADLPFAPALRLLMADRDRYSIRIGIDPATFYSEAAIDLHDFVESIIYRFVVEEGTPFLAYDISTRVGGIYREVAFDGTVLQEWPRHVVLIGTPGELEQLHAQAERMAFTLGLPT
jgi:hypothetical protein